MEKKKLVLQQMDLVLNSSVLCRSFRDLLDSGPGDSFTGRAAGQRQPRQHVREVLPGDRRVQLSGQPHHLHSARRGDAQDLQVDPVWKECAEGSLAARTDPSSNNASGTPHTAGQDPAVELLRGRLIVGESRAVFCQQETVDIVQKSEEWAAQSDDNENSWGVRGAEELQA